MSLTPTQITLIQTTFGQIADADLLAARFYARLFEIDPGTKPLFRSDMASQRQKLIQTLAVVVSSLNDLSPVIAAIQSLGQRHVTYGVKAEHWSSVGSALLWALKDALGAGFTDAARDAWYDAYMVIAQTATNVRADHAAAPLRHAE